MKEKKLKIKVELNKFSRIGFSVEKFAQKKKKIKFLGSRFP